MKNNFLVFFHTIILRVISFRIWWEKLAKGGPKWCMYIPDTSTCILMNNEDLQHCSESEIWIEIDQMKEEHQEQL